MTGLVLDKISMRFDLPDGGAVQALKNITLTIQEGELMSVLGPSGCGKTTLLNILAGFLAPTEGTIELNGHYVTGPDAERGMVFQKGALFEWMSVRQNVDFGPRMKGMAKSERDQITDHLLEVVGLQEFKEKAVYELSGGMKQRVALARALAPNPRVLLMDEPFGALDAQTREEMQRLLIELWESNQCLVIFVTHDVSEALLLADRVLVLSSSPAKVVDDFAITEPRPRSDAWLMSTQTSALKDRILARLHDGGGHGQVREIGRAHV